MQENSDIHPQAFSQDEPVSSSINHASVLPSKAASHPSQLASHASQHCEESTLRLGPAAIQLLLLVILLYAAHVQYPRLHPGFLVACASAFILLLVRNSWVSGIPLPNLHLTVYLPLSPTLVQKQAAARHEGNRAPAAHQPTQPTQQQTRQHASQPRTPNLTGVWIKVAAMEPSADASCCMKCQRNGNMHNSV